MPYSNRRSNRRPADARPAKGGVVLIFVLALFAAGGVYAWKTGMIGRKGAPDPAGKPAPSTPGVVPNGGGAPGGPVSPKRPRSIFDDTGSDGRDGATPAPRPAPADAVAPQPSSTPDRATLEAAARDAERALAQARAFAVAKLKSSPRFATQQADVDKLEAVLKHARATGSPQEKIDASAAWNKARLALDKEYEAVLLTDPTYAAAKAAAQRSAQALKAARPAAK